MASRTATPRVAGCAAVAAIEIELVPGGRGALPGAGPGGGGVPGVPPALIEWELVPGGRGALPGAGPGGGVTPGVPARITGTPAFEKLDDHVNGCSSSCLVILSPKTPRARSAMMSPTVRVIASATAFSGTLTWVL